MRKIANIAGIVLVAATLGGCQSVFGSNSASVDPSTIDMGDYFESRLAMGKLHLEANRPTRAITAFRQASYDPRYAGEAFNGMAIAYDRIDRPDLAQRYFARAVAAAPKDERFARNLARLEGRGPVMAPVYPELEPIELAVREAEKPQLHGPVTVETRPVDVAGAVAVESRPTVRVARVTQGQVAVSKQAEPAVRMALSDIDSPVRVETSRSALRVTQQVRRSRMARKASYPIRIVLNDAGSDRRN